MRSSMRVLELFSGTGSVGKVSHGNTMLCCDIIIIILKPDLSYFQLYFGKKKF